MSKYLLVICGTLILVLCGTSVYYKYQANKVPQLEDALNSKEKYIEMLGIMQGLNDATLLARDAELTLLKKKRQKEYKELEELRNGNKEVATWGDQSIPNDLLHKNANKD